MNVRQITSEDRLIQRVGQCFVEKWRKLLSLYTARGVLCHMTALRAASLALVFFDAAVEGNAQVVENFGRMLRAETSEQITIEGERIVVSDSLSEDFVWDTAALMLEATTLAPQRAFDIAMPHATFAYSAEVQREQTPEPAVLTAPFSAPTEPVAVEPASESDSDSLSSYVDFVVRTADADVLRHTILALARYNIENSHRCDTLLSQLYARLDALTAPRQGAVEYVAAKYVGTQIGTVETGGIGVQKK